MRLKASIKWRVFLNIIIGLRAMHSYFDMVEVSSSNLLRPTRIYEKPSAKLGFFVSIPCVSRFSDYVLPIELNTGLSKIIRSSRLVASLIFVAV